MCTLIVHVCTLCQYLRLTCSAVEVSNEAAAEVVEGPLVEGGAALLSC